MHVAKAFIYDADGNILLLRRSNTHPIYALQPDLPGGIIESDEDIVTGLVREVQEEAGLAVEPSDLIAAFSDQPSGKYIYHLYTAKVDQVKPKVAVSWEHDQYEWLTLAEVLQKPTDQGIDSYYAQALAWLQGTDAS